MDAPASISFCSRGRSHLSSAASRSATPLSARAAHDELSEELRDELIVTCEVPALPTYIHTRECAEDIRMAYGRYKAMEAAIAVWQNKVSAGTWTVSQKVTQLNITKIFFK